MVDYHRMGNMEGPLGNAIATTTWYQSDWWKSPRWIVIRIEALAVVAIISSFFLAVFALCRRWSNSSIVQKGFFAAQVLSLSLGTYSIGLMQSSSAKSEMYPVWTVSLFTLFGCIDPVTTYNRLDYKGPLSKVVYGICLNCVYVLLMSISTMSNVVGKAAIITLSAITFMKGFHRSFALVQQNMMSEKEFSDGIHEKENIFKTDERHFVTVDPDIGVSLAEIQLAVRDNKNKRISSCYDMCVALCLSHKLRHYFVGLDYRAPCPETLEGIDFKWALKVIEIELAFMYDTLFTGNSFFHYYQAKTASLWAVASFAGICFVLVATAIPGGMTRRSGASGCTKVVGTTTADLAITFCIVGSLAVLQLLQLVWSWTSNWARVAIACAYTEKDVLKFCQREKDVENKEGDDSDGDDSEGDDDPESWPWGQLKQSAWMRLKVFIATGPNLFDKYLWQEKISQYSILTEPRLLTVRKRKDEGISSSETKGEQKWARRLLTGWKTKVQQGFYLKAKDKGEWILLRCVDLVQTLGLHYIPKVIWELFSSDTNRRGSVKLDEDVKGSVIDFFRDHIQSDRLDESWLSSLPEEPEIRYFLPQFGAPELLRPEDHCYRYTSCVMTWHIVTWYCELEDLKRQENASTSKAEVRMCCCWGTAASYLRKAAVAIRRPGNCFKRRRGGREGEAAEAGKAPRDHRRVANSLSMYCAYLVKCAPELLPGPVAWTKRVCNLFVSDAKRIEAVLTDRVDIKTLYRPDRVTKWEAQKMDNGGMADYRIRYSKDLAKLLMHGRSSDQLWKMLALVWVQLLVYAAPYGNVEAHMRRLSQGGEFITHLWALLYHLDIREWKVQEVKNLHISTIQTIEDAQRILNDDDHDLDVVVFFVSPYMLHQYQDEFITVSRLTNYVKFYLTSSSDVAKILKFPEESILKVTSDIPYIFRRIDVLFLNNTDKKFTIFDNQVETYYIARFVYENKLSSSMARAPETAPSTSHNPNPIKKQSSEDRQTVVEIEEEVPPSPPLPPC